MMNQLLARIERLENQLNMAVGFGRSKTGNDAGNVQLLQVQLSDDETKDNVSRLAEYGHASMPPADADMLVLFLGGNRDNGVVIATGHIASRLKNLQPGESAIYDDQGQKIHITRNGIVIDGAGKPLTIQHCTDINVTATGKATITATEFDISGLAGGPLYNLLTTQCPCPFGGTHTLGSAIAKAEMA